MPRLFDVFANLGRSLSARLTARALVAAVLIGSFFSVGQIVIDIRNEKERARLKIGQIVRTITPLAARAAYELNQQSAREVLSGLNAYAPISEARIESDSGAYLAVMLSRASGNSDFGISEWIYADTREIEVVLMHENWPKPVGKLSIQVDAALLGEGVVGRAATTIAAGIFRNVFLAFVLVFVFQQFLTRPLIRLSDSFRRRGMAGRNPEPLDRPQGHETDELGELTETINQHLVALKEAEEQLLRSQRLQTTGHLTGGIAHDFNNILGIVLGNLELMKRRIPAGDEMAEFADEAYNGARRGADLTRKLLAFSRKEARDVRRIQVNDFIRKVEGLMAKSLTVSVNVTLHLDEATWPVRVDAGDFEDAVMNLSLNARAAMPGGGELIIETGNKVIDADYVLRNPSANVGEYVVVSVSDTGEGMSLEVLDRAMEPFFTTKEDGRGTGLGLSMVYGFVQRSGGHMKIYSEVGHGTTVRLYLPRGFDAAGDVSETGETSDLPRGTETILVVDDEEALLRIARRYLEELGYRVLTARTGNEALDLLDRKEGIDLLFADVVMPGGMDGYRLALAAHRLYPGLRVLLTSGFTKMREEFVNGDRAYVSKLISSLLSKPYNQAELAQAVRRVLDSREQA